MCEPRTNICRGHLNWGRVEGVGTGVEDFCTLPRTATHCLALQHTATHCNTLQHTAAHCNTLQHTGFSALAACCSVLQCVAVYCLQCGAVCWNTRGCRTYALQHTATPCNTLQHTSTHFNTLQLQQHFWLVCRTCANNYRGHQDQEKVFVR